jgi:hypothetical protein
MEAARPSDLPTTKELFERVSERERQTKDQPPRYEFTRTKTTLGYNKKGKVETRDEQTYRMVLIAGQLFPRLLAQNGQPLSGEELAKQQAKEAKFHNQDHKKKAREGDSVLAQLKGEYADRVEFAVTGRDQLDGREVYVVSVQPKKGLPAKKVEERVIARLEGRLWIDALEYEVAKVDLALTEPVRIGWGVLGAVDAFKLSIGRNRLADGGWINSAVHLWLQVRILLDTKRIQYDEAVSEVTPLNSSQP